MLVADGRRVVLGAADTFRAAAADQLQAWGQRVGAQVVRGAEGADPASVAFDAVDAGIREGADVVVVDTAGRLHTKTGLGLGEGPDDLAPFEAPAFVDALLG
ncbi:Signal recognition particle receptor FtsY [Mycobacteroides abscessus subsp. abscessus]|nr:Signal recognition particle receptor FtsY [Mycobacteroides abscessus subsp. abscessus]